MLKALLASTVLIAKNPLAWIGIITGALSMSNLILGYFDLELEAWFSILIWLYTLIFHNLLDIPFLLTDWRFAGEVKDGIVLYAVFGNASLRAHNQLLKNAIEVAYAPHEQDEFPQRLPKILRQAEVQDENKEAGENFFQEVRRLSESNAALRFAFWWWYLAIALKKWISFRLFFKNHRYWNIALQNNPDKTLETYTKNLLETSIWINRRSVSSFLVNLFLVAAGAGAILSQTIE